MRIIHTADWHIGQTLAGFPREHEHRAALADLVRIAAEQSADAMVIAGDVFDHQNPSGEALRLFFETLLALRRAVPHMSIVVTAGNHDAAGRLEAPAAMLREMGVYVVGNVRRIDNRIDANRHLIELRDRSGAVAARVLAVSYPTAACLPPFGSLAAGSRTAATVADATRDMYAEIIEGSGALRDDRPLIVTGHLHVSGGIESEGSERRILMGGQHAVPLSIFPEEIAYVALGHLHRPQEVGRRNVRYSGSLLPLSATEAPYGHGVTLLTLDGHQLTSEHIAIPRPVPFLRIPAEGTSTLDELAGRIASLDLDPNVPLEQRPFVQVHLAREGLASGHRAEVDAITRDLAIRVVGISVPPAARDASADADAAALVRLAELQPEDIFTKAFAEAHGERAPEARHFAAFHRAAAAANAET